MAIAKYGEGRAQCAIAERFSAGEDIISLVFDYNKNEDYVVTAIRDYINLTLGQYHCTTAMLDHVMTCPLKQDECQHELHQAAVAQISWFSHRREIYEEGDVKKFYDDSIAWPYREKD